jgi:hypothetical protein
LPLLRSASAAVPGAASAACTPALASAAQWRKRQLAPNLHLPIAKKRQAAGEGSLGGSTFSVSISDVKNQFISLNNFTNINKNLKNNLMIN